MADVERLTAPGESIPPKTEQIVKLQPTLFIGLGGTGLEVMLRVRRRILSAVWGPASDPVRLSSLADFPVAQFMHLDLDQAALLDTGKSETTDLMAEIVKLDDDDRIVETFDIEKYCRSDEDLARFPHIASWLPLTPRWIRELGIDPSRGSGQIRGIARLYFFDQYTKIRDKVRTKLISLRHGLTQRDQLDRLGLDLEPGQFRIVVIGSVAGGTGGGTFIDMGWLAGSIANSAVTEASVELMLFLPTGYASANRDRTEANGYASLMELEACMRSGVNTGFVDKWDPFGPQPDRLRDLPYGEVYLIDSGNLAELHTADQNDVYHMVADALFEDFNSADFARKKRAVGVNQRLHKVTPFNAAVLHNRFSDMTLSYYKGYSAFGQAILDSQAAVKRDIHVHQLVAAMLRASFGVAVADVGNRASSEQCDDFMAGQMHLSAHAFSAFPDFSSKEVQRAFGEFYDYAITEDLLFDRHGAMVAMVQQRVDRELEAIASGFVRDAWPAQVAQALQRLEKDSVLDEDSAAEVGEDRVSRRRKELFAEITRELREHLYNYLDDKELGGVEFVLSLVEQIKERLENPDTGPVHGLVANAARYQELKSAIRTHEYERLHANLGQMKGFGLLGAKDRQARSILDQLKVEIGNYLKFHLRAKAAAEAERLLRDVSRWLGEQLTADEQGNPRWSGLVGELQAGPQAVLAMLADIDRRVLLLREELKKDHATYLPVDPAEHEVTLPTAAQLREWANEAFQDFGGAKRLFKLLGDPQLRARTLAALLRYVETRMFRLAPPGQNEPDPLVEALNAMPAATRQRRFRDLMTRSMPWIDANLEREYRPSSDQYRCYIGVGNAAEWVQFRDELFSQVPTFAGLTSRQVNFVTTGIPGRAVCYTELSGIPLAVLRGLESWRTSYRREAERIPVHTHRDTTKFDHPVVPTTDELIGLAEDFKTFLLGVMLGVLVRVPRSAVPPGQYQFTIGPGDARRIGNERAFRLNGLPHNFRQRIHDAVIVKVDVLDEPQLGALATLARAYATDVYAPRLMPDEAGAEIARKGFASAVAEELAADLTDRAHREGVTNTELQAVRATDGLATWTDVVPGSDDDAYPWEVRERDANEPRLKRVVKPEFYTPGWLEATLLTAPHAPPPIEATPLKAPHAPPPIADALERDARVLLSQPSPSHAQVNSSLEQAIASDPSRTSRIRDEFGFLSDAAGRSTTEWRRRVWQLLARANSTHIEISRPAPDPLAEFHPSAGQEPGLRLTTVVDPAPPSTTGLPDPSNRLDRRPSMTAEQAGEQLESAVLALLRDFFSVEQQEDVILTKLRQQKRGSQYGHDIEFEFQSPLNWNRNIRCHVECKNIHGQITLAHVTPKVSAYDIGDEDIHHWILICPNARPSNDLNRLLAAWRVKRTYPFTVQIWSLDNGVAEFFGLSPIVYDQFYSAPEGGHPRNWPDQTRAAVVANWRRKLEPVPRLSPAWEAYVRDPIHLCLRHEQHHQMDALFAYHAEMFGRSELGVPLLDRSLDSYVRDWLAKTRSPVMFLLGDFGDGKTVFTYTLSRRLIAEFLADPSSGWIPVRFALRDYHSAGDARDFLRHRLDDFAGTLGDWNEVRHRHRILVILDGFDEMTRQIDHDSVTANIRALRSCYDEFRDCKVLVTSRTHFFSNSRDKQRLLAWLDDPFVMYMAPLSRKAVVQYLLHLAPGDDEAKALQALRAMHDPIGLGGKPLFLEMLTETLGDLPSNLDVVGLYQTYVHKTLKRKIEHLEQNEGYLYLPGELIDNLERILQDIALALQVSQRDYVSLHSWPNDEQRRWAELLWNTSDHGVDAIKADRLNADAMARVGVRSLLTRVSTPEMEETWTVDFCHRSVREYFVARRLMAALRRDLNEARHLFDIPVSNEVVDFLVALLRSDTTFDASGRLFQLLKTAVPERNPGRLGGLALTVLYRLTGSVPGEDWQGLVLDSADLTGADLSHKNFSNSSLRYANLDNVNLEHSTFAFSDLTGVRLEETAAVQSIAVMSEDTFLAAYADGTMRVWDISRSQRPVSRIVVSARPWISGRLGVQPGGEIWVLDQDSLAFFDWTRDGTLVQAARFATRSDIRDVHLHDDDLVALVEVTSARSMPVRVSYENHVASLCGPESPTVFCVGVSEIGFVTFDGEHGLRLSYLQEATHWRSFSLDQRRTSCINTYRLSDESLLIGAGYENGDVRVWLVERDAEAWQATQLLDQSAHQGNVSAVAFLSEERIVTGGQDRSIAVIHYSRGSRSSAVHLERLQLTLRCQGMTVHAVRGRREEELLQSLILRGSGEIEQGQTIA